MTPNRQLPTLIGDVHIDWTYVIIDGVVQDDEGHCQPQKIWQSDKNYEEFMRYSMDCTIPWEVL